MKLKVKKTVDTLANIIKQWESSDTLLLLHFAEKEINDPNFSVTMDLFFNGSIPVRQERQELFDNAQYFETSAVQSKDRFFWDDIPVRISYKNCEKVEKVISAVNSNQWLLMEDGTYLFHRIATGQVEWSRGKWLESIRPKLDRLPDSFWNIWIESCQIRSDHYLSDMRAAVWLEDQLYYLFSLAGFVKSIAQLLFALNHEFEPGPRVYTASLSLLELLPEGFEADWASLLRDDPELMPERKREIAAILAHKIFALSPLS